MHILKIFNKINKKIKSIIEVLFDKKTQIEFFIKNNEIKKLNEKNLLKIVNFYNSL
jgi:hypothetical protein